MNDKLIIKENGSISIEGAIGYLESIPNTEEAIEALKSIRHDKVKGAINTAIKAHKYNRSEVFRDFLSDGEKSDTTKKVYTDKCKVFFDWIDRQNMHEFVIERKTVNIYKQYLKEKINKKGDKYSNNSIRTHLSSISSFYTYLEDELYIEKSPFSHIKYPKKVYKKAVKTDQERTIPVMNISEYTTLIDELKQRIQLKGKTLAIKRKKESAKKLLPIVYFLGEYGLRIQDALTIELHFDDGYFSFIQKGNIVKKKNLKPESLSIIKGLNKKPFKDTVKITPQKAIHRLTTYLYSSGKIRYAYSCHDFRHYFAVQFYLQTKDILQVQRALGHSSVATTQIYLQSLLGEDF